MNAETLKKIIDDEAAQSEKATREWHDCFNRVYDKIDALTNRVAVIEEVKPSCGHEPVNGTFDNLLSRVEALEKQMAEPVPEPAPNAPPLPPNEDDWNPQGFHLRVSRYGLAAAEWLRIGGDERRVKMKFP